MASYLDAQLAVLEYVDQLPGVAKSGTKTDDLATLPFVRVIRTSGNDDEVTDFARVQIHVFASTEAAAYDVSDGIRNSMKSFKREVVLTNRYIDKVVCEQAPVYVDYQNENVQRYVSVFVIHSRVVDPA